MIVRRRGSSLVIFAYFLLWTVTSVLDMRAGVWYPSGSNTKTVLTCVVFVSSKARER